MIFPQMTTKSPGAFNVTAKETQRVCSSSKFAGEVIRANGYVDGRSDLAVDDGG